MEKIMVSCPYFRQVYTHGTCRAYPDGLMNPSVDEIKTLCLNSYHTKCVYYQGQKKLERKPESAIPFNNSTTPV